MPGRSTQSNPMPVIIENTNLSPDQNINTATRNNCDRFKTPTTAGAYPTSYRTGNRRDEREKNAILRCLRYIPTGSRLLDFPCGSGRLLGLLQSAGYEVSGADSSLAMLEKIRAQSEYDGINLYESDVFASGFQDGEFDSVITNRLFHHFTCADDRKTALRELGRISRGRVVISYFDCFSASMTIRRISKYARGKAFLDRVPLSYPVFRKEIGETGMRVVYRTAARWGVSPLCYVVIERSPLALR